MKRISVAFVLSLGILVSARGGAQSIGPDGRALPAYSGREATPPTTLPVVNPSGVPSLPTPATPSVAKSPVASASTCPTVSGAYYMQSNSWVPMDPSHSVGFKTTNVAGAAFRYGATKMR